MTSGSETGPANPDKPQTPETRTETRRWTHHHALFVAAVITGYRIKIYEHKKVHLGKIGKGIESWDADDQAMAIEEGRRQLDGQFSELQYVTSRASVLLTVGIAASVFFLTALNDLGDLAQPRHTIALVLLVTSSLMTLWGALIMGALIGDRAPFKQTDAVQLTQEPGDLRKHLARDYAENVPTGVDTNAARLTHLGTGVIWIAIGALLGVTGLTVSMWPAPSSLRDDMPTDPETYLDENQSPGKESQPPAGWVNRSRDDRWKAGLVATGTITASLYVRCYTAGPYRAEMGFHYDPFSDSDKGYGSRARWGFFTDGKPPGLAGTHDKTDITDALRHAIMTEEYLVLEIDAHQGPMRPHPPLVYRHHVVFDLTVGREVVTNVIDRCRTG